MKKIVVIFLLLLLSSKYTCAMDEDRAAQITLMIIRAASGLGKSTDEIRQLQQINPSDIAGIGRKKVNDIMKYRAILENGDEILAKHFTQTNESRCLRMIKNPNTGQIFYIPLVDNVIALLAGTYDLNVDANGQPYQ